MKRVGRREESNFKTDEVFLPVCPGWTPKAAGIEVLAIITEVEVGEKALRVTDSCG